jgi:hypothetical protein
MPPPSILSTLKAMKPVLVLEEVPPGWAEVQGTQEMFGKIGNSVSEEVKSSVV